MTFRDIFKSGFIENMTAVSLLDMVTALALAFLLAAIYGQQQIFAKEEPAERPLPYEIAFEEPDGWDGYYTVRPQVTITHPGPAGETVYVLEHDGGAGAQGRICEAGGQAVIGQEQPARGRGRPLRSENPLPWRLAGSSWNPQGDMPPHLREPQVSPPSPTWTTDRSRCPRPSSGSRPQ